MVAIIGSGSWATALAKIVSHSFSPVYWWVREDEIAESLREFGHNQLYLSSIEFEKEKIIVSTDLKEVISHAEILLFVVPAAFLHVSLHGICPEDLKGKKICSAIKGIVPETNQIVADYFNVTFQVPYSDICVISGPSHAEEVAQEKLTYLTVASRNKELAEDIAEKIRCRFVKTTFSEDIHGIEYAAVLKNIYALAAGICKGLGLGDNFIAVLLSNAMQEMERFLENAYPIPRQLSKFAYLGDLLVTAYSQHSRNRTFGTMIGSGYSVKAAQLDMKMIAEGYYAALSMKIINEKYKVPMPILYAVYNILYENKPAYYEIKALIDKFL